MSGFWYFTIGVICSLSLATFYEPEPIACPEIESTICNLIHAIDDDCDGIDFLNHTDGPNYDYKCKNINNFRHINIRDGMR